MELVTEYATKKLADQRFPRDPALSPIAYEIEKYCDEYLTDGCDVDVMEALMAQAAELREKEKAKKGANQQPIRWTARSVQEAVEAGTARAKAKMMAQNEA